MFKMKKTVIVSAIIATSILLSGCGLFGGNEKSKKVDPPQNVSYLGEEDEINVSEKTDEAGKKKAKEETTQEKVKTELYLIDKDGYVVPQTLDLPRTESVAKQALEYLVENGPVTDMLPSGFRAVLPADTEIKGVNIKDGIALVDFSKEFTEYKPEDELKILQSVTWTLTQFDQIKSVKIMINGHELKEMPANGTPIEEGLTRKIGINLDTSEISDVANTKSVTVYYIAENGDSSYYVPVTRRVSNKIENNVEAVVKKLIEGPSYTSSLLTEFLPDVALIDPPKVDNGKVTLNFNESILGSFEEKMISKHLLNSLVLSLTEQQGIESVSVMVDGSTEVINEEGEKLSEPVTRPEKINTGSF
ncbi:GerMN domain-containing protein [Bacillus aquiflavi]|uniref:GerMN domain-containing protein n=1 Tax=Bacillus aquiflavi TaxID=2672567 RepID=A0A6B3VXT8_9BACI|nr:GerMN domain-containing protein [Bacillus aquiflavi]MBA4537487.1 GerMN domain-containing protein [Bacillus aquiflavi]NEY81742.1 sporulation protein [Bacillus aquiflavi]UAC47455.1 GerMN domain-containing protein [Bacillus aquiflavi]